MSNKELVNRVNELAKKCLSEGKKSDAAELFIKAINIDPTSTVAVVYLTDLYVAEKKYSVAEKILKGAIKISPNDEHFYMSLGKLYAGLKDSKNAKPCFEKAVQLNSNLKGGMLNLGFIAAENHDYDIALRFYDKALKIDPHYSLACNNKALVLRELGEFERAFEYQKKAIDKDPKSYLSFSNLLFYMSQFADVSPEDYLEKAKEYGRVVSADASPFLEWPHLIDNEKIRVGFVSADFRKHPVTFFIESWIDLLDKNRFELVAYNNSAQRDKKTLDLHSMFNEWYQITDLSDVDLAQKIHHDRINILIDLSGHTAHNRLPAFAWKPAPIQISWIGFPTSTGMKEIDYMMPNIVMSPPEFNHHYLEKQWYLTSGGCLEAPAVEIEVNQLPAIKNGYITFGSFHRATKLTDQVLECWSDILLRIPQSRLFFKCIEFKSSKVRERLLEKMLSFGITADRLILEGPCNLNEYFKAYHSVDIGLDPFPYNAGTVGYHSLWMGVPFVTLKGDRLLSRVGCSSLCLVGLDQFVSDNTDEYIQAAVDAVSDLNKLQEIRIGLREKALASGLYNAENMARELECAFEGMWDLYLKKSSQ